MEKTILNCEVLKITEKALSDIAKEMGMTVGEVIDRVALNWKAQDPVYAAQLILEEIAIIFHHLKKNQAGESLVFVLNVLNLCNNDYSAESIKKATEAYFSRCNEVDEIE